MAQNVNPTFVKTPNAAVARISTGTGAAVPVTVYTGAANGSKVNALIATSFNTTASFDVQWGLTTSGVIYYCGTAAVAANAGAVSATPSVNLMSNANVPLAVDSDGNPFIFLPSSAWALFAETDSTSSTWASSAFINVIAPSIGDF